ncbi:MAG: flippase-like domain-containing protein [Anaerolineaceae bacterium]|nr:flippase-like domain-containing protein [Anaerolineaceae bacterium]
MTSSSTDKQRRSNGQRLAILIGILISAAFLYLAFRELQPETFIDSISQVNFFWLIAGAATYALAVIVIALRWQFLLRAVKPIALIPLSQVVAVGYMGNNVYPLRAGEALRVYLLKRNHDVPIAQAATTAVVERAFDGLVMLSFIVVGLLVSDIASPQVESVVSLAAPIFGLAMLIFFVLAAKPDWLRALVNLAARFLPGRLHDMVLSLAEGVIEGLEGLRSPLYLAGTIISSFVTWGIEAFVYWMVMWAFGLELSYAVALLVVGTVNLAGLIPASPGQVGVYEFFASTVLMAAGIRQETALAYAVVVHIVIWLPVTVVGFLILARMGLSMRSVRQSQSLEAQPALDS